MVAIPSPSFSAQRDPDIDRLKREVAHAFRSYERLLEAVIGGRAAGSLSGTLSIDYLTSAVEDGGVIDHDELVGLGDDDHAQYLRTDGTRPLSAGWAVGGQAISGVGALGAASATITGDVSQASASPVYYLGNGTGSPTWLANKSDAGDAYAPLWRVAGINRWAWYFATDEDLQLLRWNAAGVFQDLTEISAVDGSWTFPAAVRIANGLEIVAGGLDVTGNIAVTGTVDAVDVSDHSSRHDHGGADARIPARGDTDRR